MWPILSPDRDRGRQNRRPRRELIDRRTWHPKLAPRSRARSARIGTRSRAALAPDSLPLTGDARSTSNGKSRGRPPGASQAMRPPPLGPQSASAAVAIAPRPEAAAEDGHARGDAGGVVQRQHLPSMRGVAPIRGAVAVVGAASVADLGGVIAARVVQRAAGVALAGAPADVPARATATGAGAPSAGRLQGAATARQHLPQSLLLGEGPHCKRARARAPVAFRCPSYPAQLGCGSSVQHPPGRTSEGWGAMAPQGVGAG